MNRTLTNADPNVEDQIDAELREIFREDVPATYLVPLMPASVAHRRIRGLRAPFRTDVLRIMDELRLQDER